MSDDNLSKTLIIPNPGGRRKTSEPEGQKPQSPPPGQQPPHGNVTQAQNIQGNISYSKEGENPLLSAGNEILILASNLRSLEPSNTIERLRQDIENLINRFNTDLSNAGISNEIALTGRYLICCLLDELVLSTPWGTESSWSQQTLLSKYHNETWGGEKFFLIANKLLEQPQRNIDLIELCYVCLSAGFSGKHRIGENGPQELQRISQLLYQPIEQFRPVSRDLSPSWEGAGEQKQGLVKQFPTWIIFLVFIFVAVVVYIGFLSSLTTKAEPTYQKLESIGWQEYVHTINENQPDDINIEEIALSVRNSLAREIANSIVAIDVRDNMLVIRLMSTSLFKSGSSVVNEDALPDVNKLVNTMKDYADTILVIGHTDSTGKAESNWVISRKRAEAIAQWLKKANSQFSNTITRGVADTQPLMDDSNSEYNQSLNRRVELILVLKG